jgi:hypothetical protein
MATAKKSAKKKKTAPTLVDLSSDEVRALPKPREGFADQAADLVALYEKHAGVLGEVETSTTAIREDLAAWHALGPVEQAAIKHAEMATETRLLHAARAWSGMLEIYKRAQAAAPKNRAVASAIEPFEKFMSVGPRKKPTEK